MYEETSSSRILESTNTCGVALTELIRTLEGNFEVIRLHLKQVYMQAVLFLNPEGTQPYKFSSLLCSTQHSRREGMHNLLLLLLCSTQLHAGTSTHPHADTSVSVAVG